MANNPPESCNPESGAAFFVSLGFAELLKLLRLELVVLVPLLPPPPIALPFSLLPPLLSALLPALVLVSCGLCVPVIEAVKLPLLPVPVAVRLPSVLPDPVSVVLPRPLALPVSLPVTLPLPVSVPEDAAADFMETESVLVKPLPVSKEAAAEEASEGAEVSELMPNWPE